MIDINIEELENRIKQFPESTQKMLIRPEKDSSILAIFKDNNIVDDVNVINSISNGIKLVATQFMSKTDLYELIRFRLNNNDFLARKIFAEFDTKILSPNNFNGLIDNRKIEDVGKEEAEEEDELVSDEESEIEKKEVVQQTSSEPEKSTETAEDILKEIENPTPYYGIVSGPTQTLTTTSGVPLSATLTPNAVTSTSPSSLESTTPTTPKKEEQLDSKLTEPVVQPSKSTYYKVDPYREQPE